MPRDDRQRYQQRRRDKTHGHDRTSGGNEAGRDDGDDSHRNESNEPRQPGDRSRHDPDRQQWHPLQTPRPKDNGKSSAHMHRP